MSITAATILGQAEVKTQTPSGTLNNTTIGIPFLNEAMLDFRTELIKRGVDASQTQEAYTSMISGQGTYAWPSDMYVLKTIELNYTDSSQANYVQAEIFDVANIQSTTSFDFVRLNQPSTNPLFDDRGDTYEIFPTPTAGITNGIRIFYFLQPTPYVNTSDTITYPDTLDLYILSLKVAALYYESLNKFQEADYWNKQYQDRLSKLTTTVAQGSKQPIEPQRLNITGFEY